MGLSFPTSSIVTIQNMLRIPRPAPEAIKTVLDQIAEIDPRAANLRPEQFIDSRFFQEMEKDGFLQRLWGKG